MAIAETRRNLQLNVEFSTVVSGGFVVLIIQIIGAALSFVALALVARLIGQEEYGVFAFYLSLAI